MAKDLNRCIEYDDFGSQCLNVTSYEDKICRSCRPKSKLLNFEKTLNGEKNIWGDNKKRDPKKTYDEKGKEKYKEPLIVTIISAILVLLFIGIMQQQGQESIDIQNESLPGRYDNPR